MKNICKRGHEMTEQNTYHRKDNSGVKCRTCINNRTKVWLEKHPEHLTGLKPKYAIFKSKAKEYKKEFTVTREEYESLVSKGLCEYCSGPLPKRGYGVDRKDHRLGYTIENCAACCEHCNRKKGNLEGLGFFYPRTVELLLELLGK
jgi:5-methylcytosine-specific restriction endonuclease McrA